MSTSADWTVEPAEPGWFGRLIAPSGGGRPATMTFVLGLLGGGAFVGSLALDWQSVTAPSGSGELPEAFPEQHFASGIASVDTLSLVYTLGVVALLGLIGAVVTRPDLALRLRMAAAGVTVGLLGVLVAVTVRLSDTIINMPVLAFGLTVEQMEQLTLSYEPGVFCGYAAVVLSGAAIWYAGRTASTDEAPAEADGAADEPRARRAPAARRGSNAGRGSSLEVSFSDPLDLSVGPGETWQPQR